MLGILSTPLLSLLNETVLSTLEYFSIFLRNVAAESELEKSVETINVLIWVVRVWADQRRGGGPRMY